MLKKKKKFLKSLNRNEFLMIRQERLLLRALPENFLEQDSSKDSPNNILKILTKKQNSVVRKIVYINLKDKKKRSQEKIPLKSQEKKFLKAHCVKKNI